MSDESTATGANPDAPDEPDRAEARAGARWIRHLDADQILFEEGEEARRVYVLIQGRVSITKGGHRVAEIGVADSFIGEVAALTGRPRWATARTVEPSTMLVVDDVTELFALEPAWGEKLARVLATRLDRTNERFRRLQELLELTRQNIDGGVDETQETAVRVDG